MFKKSLIALALVGAGVSVQAATIDSSTFDACNGPYANTPQDQPDDRVFSITLEGGATCVAGGIGNLQGEQSEAALIPGTGWSFLEKNPSGTSLITGVTGLNGASGTITLASNIWSLYSSLAIGLKTGEGQWDPDWVIFTITGSDTTIDFSITPTQASGLSHVNLYGVPATTVPAPGTLGLLGLGLVGLGLVRRKQQA